MAMNLATKYNDKLIPAWYQTSLVAGKTNTDYSWDGVKSILVHDLVTQTPGTYTANGTNRYGTPADVEDNQQTLTVAQTMSNSLIIDKTINSQQMMMKKAGEVASAQVKEQYQPKFDKYCLDAFAKGAGTTKTETAAATTETILKQILAARTAFVNAKVPTDGRYLYIGSSVYALLLESKEFIGADKLNVKVLEAGVVGKVYGFLVVECPDDYMPKDVQFIAVHKSACTAPLKLNELNIHTNPPGIAGHQIDMLWMYDAHVLNKRKYGIYVSKTTTATK